MGLKFLDGRSWAEVTRDERFFCQRLYELIRFHGVPKFITYMNGACNLSLSVDSNWEPVYEACFYRDLWTLRDRVGPVHSLKRTFDLGLFSDDSLVIIEAKAYQDFEPDQLNSFADDLEQVRKETGVSVVVLVGLASSRYVSTEGVRSVFGQRLLTWNGLASLYSDDPILQRADDIYEPDRVTFGAKNNLGGYERGSRLLLACERGERFFVGRDGGIDGVKLAEDIASGKWRSQKYQTNRTATAPPNRNWFSLEEFCKRISKT